MTEPIEISRSARTPRPKTGAAPFAADELFFSRTDARGIILAANPVFAALDTLQPAPWGDFGAQGTCGGAPFGEAVGNYYMTDPISRSSDTMAKCGTEFGLGPRTKATGTHG